MTERSRKLNLITHDADDDMVVIDDSADVAVPVLLSRMKHYGECENIALFLAAVDEDDLRAGPEESWCALCGQSLAWAENHLADCAWRRAKELLARVSGDNTE